MKKLILASATIMSFTGVAYAADPPDWMKQVTPPQQLSSAWQEYQAIFSDGALPEKTKELVGLAVAAQIPCQYCIIATHAAGEGGRGNRRGDQRGNRRRSAYPQMEHDAERQCVRH